MEIPKGKLFNIASIINLLFIIIYCFRKNKDYPILKQ